MRKYIIFPFYFLLFPKKEKEDAWLWACVVLRTGGYCRGIPPFISFIPFLNSFIFFLFSFYLRTRRKMFFRRCRLVPCRLKRRLYTAAEEMRIWRTGASSWGFSRKDIIVYMRERTKVVGMNYRCYRCYQIM
jgi:hypothetical protein